MADQLSVRTDDGGWVDVEVIKYIDLPHLPNIVFFLHEAPEHRHMSEYAVSELITGGVFTHGHTQEGTEMLFRKFMAGTTVDIMERVIDKFLGNEKGG